MKRISTFSSILNFENGNVLYNSFTNQALFTRISINKGYIENVLEDEPESNLIKQLSKIGFIVDITSEREISNLEYRLACQIDNPCELQLHINPTMECNMHCWYCYEKHIPDSTISEEILIGLERYLNGKIQSRDLKKISLCFFGGEPFLKFDKVKCIIERANISIQDTNIKLYVSFTTNGYLVNENIINYLKNFDVGFQITLDGSKKKHDKIRFIRGREGTYDQILKNIKELTNNDIPVIIRFNYTKDNISDLPEIVSDLERLKINNKMICIDIQRVWQTKISSHYDSLETIAQEYRHKIRKYGYNVLNNNVISALDNICYGCKKNHLVINYNGDLFRCTARDFKNEDRVGYINNEGVFLDDDINMLNIHKLFGKCKICRIAPLCGGGCYQRRKESNSMHDCIFNYSESDIDKYIYNILSNMISHYENNRKDL